MGVEVGALDRVSTTVPCPQLLTMDSRQELYH